MSHGKPDAFAVTESDASTGESQEDGQEKGLCFCGASPDEHERMYMHYYLFGDKPDTIFADGAKTLDDIEVNHYYQLFEYLSTSEFVREEHRRYFVKELQRARDWQTKSRAMAKRFRTIDLADALEQKWAHEYASCVPRSDSWRFFRIFVRILNGTHVHRFKRTMGGSLYCHKCGSPISRDHDLGGLVIRGTSAVVPGREFEYNYCVRCGALPAPYLVVRARGRLRRWYGRGVRGSKWVWTRVRHPVPLGVLMIMLGHWSAGWWPF